MYHKNPWSDYCALCGDKLLGDCKPFYHRGKHLPVHAKCQIKFNTDLVKAIEDAEDGPIVVLKYQDDLGAFTVSLVRAFFAGAAVATCAFLLWM